MNTQAQPMIPGVENRFQGGGTGGNPVASRLPILLSSLVFPGLGQMFQRRWYSGIFFGVVFFASLVALVIPVVETIIAFYGMANIDATFDAAPDAAKRLAGQIGIRFAWAIAIYVINIVDVGVADMRRRSKQHILIAT
ncbi:MAG: hypothetical protein E4H02_09505 [Lentisphaerales bacterium]|nr:MAG: hypothetical protein E4H02_09505 [Lentisphaerales bacterium]